MGLGPGAAGPVIMKDGGGPTSGLPPRPPIVQGPLRWFGLGMTTGVVGTFVVIIAVATFTH